MTTQSKLAYFVTADEYLFTRKLLWLLLRFDFCDVDQGTKPPSENLGQVLFGDRYHVSGYKVIHSEIFISNNFIVCPQFHDLLVNNFNILELL